MDGRTWLGDPGQWNRAHVMTGGGPGGKPKGTSAHRQAGNVGGQAADPACASLNVRWEAFGRVVMVTVIVRHQQDVDAVQQGLRRQLHSACGPLNAPLPSTTSKATVAEAILTMKRWLFMAQTRKPVVAVGVSVSRLGIRTASDSCQCRLRACRVIRVRVNGKEAAFPALPWPVHPRIAVCGLQYRRFSAA